MAQGSQWAVRLNGLDAGGQASGIGIINTTWEVWARIPQYDPNYPTSLPIMSSYGSWTTLCPLMSPGTGSCSGASGYGNPGDAPVSGLNLSQGAWHHLATVFGPDPAPGYKFFVDGQLVQTVSPAGNAVAVGLETDLGCSRYIGYQSFLKADLDEVRISVGARYTTNFIPTPYFTPDASTVGLWHFNEGAGSMAHDASGNGSDFTLFGGYSWVDGILPMDCNANGVPDNQEMSASAALDCNGNQRLDECELTDGTSFDCNGNGRLDECDITQGSSTDSNGNGIPDDCERRFCFGDGFDQSHTTSCPCGNSGGPRRGCANSVNALGAVLVASGTTVPDAIVLDGSAMPSSSLCIYLQGDSLADAMFGDGVRCTGG